MEKPDRAAGQLPPPGARGCRARDLEGDLIMDDRSKTGAAERKRINVLEEYEVRDWAKSFGVAPDEIKKAVESVGDSADASTHLPRPAGGRDGKEKVTARAARWPRFRPWARACSPA